MEAIPLPPPYSGQRDDLPLVMIGSPYAEKVINFNLDDGAAKLRHGDSVHSTGGTSFVFALATYGFGSSQKLFGVNSDGGTLKVIDCSTAGAVSVAYNPGGPSDDTEIHTLFFNNVLTFFGEIDWTPGSLGCPSYNGSVWGSSGYTYPTITVPFGGTSFKNRAYIIERNGTKYAYSAINAISGLTVEVDLAQVMSAKGYLYGIRSVSLSEGLEQENVLCFVFNTGEVLAYSGSYPDSSDWKLIGRFIISPPIYYNAFIDARGDSFVITKTGLISLRTLFTQGVEIATQQALSGSIRNRWKQIVNGSFAGSEMIIRGMYDQINDRVVISFPALITETGALDTDKSLRLVFSFKTESWAEHHVDQDNGNLASSGVVFYKNAPYYGVWEGVMKMEGASDFIDASASGGSNNGYPYELTSAPIASGRTYVSRADGLDLIMESDMHDITNYQFISDLGVTESVAQKLPSNTALTLSKPNVNMGIEGSYIQFKVSGNTTSGKTVGLNIYGVNVWTQSGRSPR